MRLSRCQGIRPKPIHYKQMQHQGTQVQAEECVLIDANDDGD